MRVAVVGAHGKVAMRLAQLLVARGDTVTGLVRNPAHADDLRAIGADPVICDLESAAVTEVTGAVGAADAVVFAAGAGAGSGAERKLNVDRDGAVKLLNATAEGRPRYVMISSVGAENPPSDDDVFSVYLRAKAEADAAVMTSDRAWTIVRPGSLTDDPGTGRVRIDTDPFHGKVSRDDVAAVLAAVLSHPRAAGHVVYVSGGSERVDQALDAAFS